MNRNQWAWAIMLVLVANSSFGTTNIKFIITYSDAYGATTPDLVDISDNVGWLLSSWSESGIDSTVELTYVGRFEVNGAPNQVTDPATFLDALAHNQAIMDKRNEKQADVVIHLASDVQGSSCGAFDGHFSYAFYGPIDVTGRLTEYVAFVDKDCMGYQDPAQVAHEFAHVVGAGHEDDSGESTWADYAHAFKVGDNLMTNVVGIVRINALSPKSQSSQGMLKFSDNRAQLGFVCESATD